MENIKWATKVKKQWKSKDQRPETCMQKKKRKKNWTRREGIRKRITGEIGKWNPRRQREKRENDIFQVFGGNAIAKHKRKQTGSPRQIGVKERASFTWYHKRSLHHWPSINPHLRHGNCLRNPFTAKRTAPARHRRARHRHPRPCRVRPRRVRGPGRAHSRGPRARSPRPWRR